MFNPVTLAAIGLLALAAPPATPPVPALPRMPAIPAIPPIPPIPAMPAFEAWLPTEIPASLDWELKPSGSDEAPGTVQFQLGYHTPGHSSMFSETTTLAGLDGLAAAHLAAPGQPVSFVLHRDAGDFNCKGVAGQGKGVGTCMFVPNGGFSAALARRGVAGAPQPYQQFQLALLDIGFPYLDELKRQGYANPGLDDLMRAGTHGAGLRHLKAMDAAGYRFGTVANLVKARDHGVSARYVEALRAAGYSKLSVDDLVRLRDHGVSATYIAQLKDSGYGGLGTEDMVRLRDHGVSAGFLRSANEGGRRLSPDELIRMRDAGERR